MTYANHHGEFDDSRDVQLGGMGLDVASWFYFKPIGPWYDEAKAAIDAAEARGVDAQIIASMRAQLNEYYAAKDVDSIIALKLSAEGYTKTGNQGPVATQEIEKIKQDIETTVEAAKQAAKNVASTGATLLGVGVIAFGAYLAWKAWRE